MKKSLIGVDLGGTNIRVAAISLKGEVLHRKKVPTDPEKGKDVVILLAGHVLKDPDYTVRYHLGELYEDYVVETQMIKKSNHLRSTYANRPIEVPADRDAIVGVIQEHLATGASGG